MRRTSFWDGRESLRGILDGLPVSTFVCDMQMNMVYISPAAQEVMRQLRCPVREEFGVDVDQLLSMSIHRFHKDPAGVERILAQPNLFPYRAQFELAGLRLETIITAVRDSLGGVVGYIAILDDVTDKHHVAEQLTNTSEELGESSQALAGMAEELSVTTAEAKRQADDMADGTRTLAAAIDAISTGTVDVAADTRAAVESASAATNDMAELTSASDRIGEVTKLISAIAEQTRLLALNASIEAAHAGAAGSGFAVVANEVRSLAQETHSATSQITEMIDAIQSSTSKVSATLAAISAKLAEIDRQQGAISMAANDGSASAQQISSLVDQVARGIHDISAATSMASDSASSLSSKAITLGDLVTTARGA